MLSSLGTAKTKIYDKEVEFYSNFTLKDYLFDITLPQNTPNTTLKVSTEYEGAIIPFGQCEPINDLQVCYNNTRFDLIIDGYWVRVRVYELECTSWYFEYDNTTGNYTENCRLRLGETCKADDWCNSRLCVHGTCQPERPYCTDNICDIAEDCEADCANWSGPRAIENTSVIDMPQQYIQVNPYLEEFEASQNNTDNTTSTTTTQSTQQNTQSTTTQNQPDTTEQATNKVTDTANSVANRAESIVASNINVGTTAIFIIIGSLFVLMIGFQIYMKIKKRKGDPLAGLGINREE